MRSIFLLREILDQDSGGPLPPSPDRIGPRRTSLHGRSLFSLSEGFNQPVLHRELTLSGSKVTSFEKTPVADVLARDYLLPSLFPMVGLGQPTGRPAPFFFFFFL